MALENKAQKLKRESLEGLSFIVTATKSEVGYMFVPAENAEWLAKNGFVELDNSNINGDGFIATRATEKGISKVMSEDTNVVVAAPQFVIENVPVVVAKKGGGKKGVAYPFDALEVGQSFVVPATEKRPDPAKSLASTITNANAKYAELVFEEDGTTPKMRTVKNPKTGATREAQVTKLTRKFSIVACDGGCRIGRTL